MQVLYTASSIVYNMIFSSTTASHTCVKVLTLVQHTATWQSHYMNPIQPIRNKLHVSLKSVQLPVLPAKQVPEYTSCMKSRHKEFPLGHHRPQGALLQGSVATSFNGTEVLQ